MNLQNDISIAQWSLNWAAESYRNLLEYAKPTGIKILIENHGGVSNDPTPKECPTATNP